jgi:hypothetical protein
MAEPLDLVTELGAFEGTSTQRLTLYIPNMDRDGQVVVDQEQWVGKARELLTAIGRGATALPPADGNWLNEETGTVIWEQTRIVYCFIVPDRFRARIKDLRTFLHRFGRETNQGEVVVEFDNRFYRIRQFD